MDVLQNYAFQALSFYTNTTSTTSQKSPPPPPPPINLPPQLTNLLTQLLPSFQLLPSVQQLQQLTAPLYTHLTSSPLIVSFITLLFTLFLSLKLISLIRRFMWWMTMLIFRIVFWGMISIIAVAAWQGNLGEWESWVSGLKGWGEEVGRVWWGEYERWNGMGGKVGGR